jgi:hypothetical protein
MPTESFKPTFAQASKGWHRLVTGHGELTDGEARVCAVLYRYFSAIHYNETGELKAWPNQKTLAARSTKCEGTVKNTIQKLKALKLLEVERGYDHTTKKRTVNIYVASNDLLLYCCILR